jgi:hypothetical protein
MNYCRGTGARLPPLTVRRPDWAAQHAPPELKSPEDRDLRRSPHAYVLPLSKDRTRRAAHRGVLGLTCTAYRIR